MSATQQSLVCLTTSGACGGAETSLLTLLEALRRLEPAWAMAVVAPAAGSLLDHCQRLGIDAVVHPYPAALAKLGEHGAAAVGRGQLAITGVRTAAALPPYIASLRRLLRMRRATIVHCNGFKAHVSAALAGGRQRIVWHLHDYVQRRRLTARLLRLLSGRAHAIVANSDSVMRDAGMAFGPGVRVRRVYNAVDAARYAPEGPALDLARLAGLPSDAGLVRIGLVATFARWKGHDVFVDAIAGLAGERVRAYVVGGAVYETAGSQWSEAELRARVAGRGLSDVIGFTGHVDDVPAALRALDVVVHASVEPEPFGMVIADAMTAGRPVVAARAGGAAELFESGVDGVGYEAGSAGELTRALRALIADPELRQRLGAAARVRALAQFAPARMAAEFREVYGG